jgi:polysaccharide biosynthesis protein PslJ
MAEPAALGGSLNHTARWAPFDRTVAVFWAAVAVLVGVVLVTSYTRFQATGTLAAIAFLLVVVAWRETLLAWPTLLALIVGVILFVPIRRYTLGGGLPFALEPYRVLIAVVLVAWLAALLVDPKTRFRRTGLEAPVLFLLAGIGCSLVLNTGRVGAVSETVVKGLTFFVSFFFVLYFISSAVTSRRALDRVVTLLVVGGVAVALAAVVEWRTNYNVFNDLGRVIPVLDFSELGIPSTPDRGDRPRAYASAQHSIALGAALVMIIPLAVYLYRRSGGFGWMAGAAILTLGAMATGSRTAVVMLGTILVAFLVVKRKETLRLLPLLLPLFVVVQLVMPGTLGTFRATFTPEEGLVADELGDAGQSGSGRLADVGPSLEEWSRTPIFGQGFGTRLPSTSDDVINAMILDNQWLSSLLELGLLGAIALVWLFVRATRRLGRVARVNDEPHGWLLTGLCASIAAFAIGMFTFDAFSFTQVTFLVFIMLGLSAAALRFSAEDARDEPRSQRPALAGLR